MFLNVSTLNKTGTVSSSGKGFEVSNEIGTGFVQEQTGRSKDANFLSAQNSALRGASSPV